jgi:hypothetical protein
VCQFIEIDYCKNKYLFCIKPGMEELKTFFRKYEHLFLAVESSQWCFPLGKGYP